MNNKNSHLKIDLTNQNLKMMIPRTKMSLMIKMMIKKFKTNKIKSQSHKINRKELTNNR
jgi:hypothetical protein